jgi:hypothetical protein
MPAEQFGESSGQLRPKELRPHQAYLRKEPKLTPGTAVNRVAAALLLFSSRRLSGISSESSWLIPRTGADRRPYRGWRKCLRLINRGEFFGGRG